MNDLDATAQQDSDDGQLETRRGIRIWSYNPSISSVPMTQKEIPFKFETDNQLMLVNANTGEMVGSGTAAFLKRSTVDNSQFMKVYFGQLKAMYDLTKTAQHVFMIVWDQVQSNKDQDKILLKPVMAKMLGIQISERVFQKGVRELLEKEFIYMSPFDGMYYINMGIFFNGNRLVVVNEYIKQQQIANDRKGHGDDNEG